MSLEHGTFKQRDKGKCLLECQNVYWNSDTVKRTPGEQQQEHSLGVGRVQNGDCFIVVVMYSVRFPQNQTYSYELSNCPWKTVRT